MVYYKDIEETRYKEITDSSFTPLKLRLDWAQKVKEGKSCVQLFITKNFETNLNNYYLMVGLPVEADYLILSYTCEQAPTFVISDICYLIMNNLQNHGNNSYLVNQYLNGNGYKNLDHIVMDIFTQEMSIKIGQHYLTDTAVLFNDYSYLIQKALSDVHTTINTTSIVKGSTQNFFFFLLTVEESIKKLNQEFMFLYFCFFKLAQESITGKSSLVSRLKILKRNYFVKVDHHISILKRSLETFRASKYDSDALVVESIEFQLENLLRNMNLFELRDVHLKQPLVEIELKVP